MPCFQSHVHDSAGKIVGFGLFIEFIVSCGALRLGVCLIASFLKEMVSTAALVLPMATRMRSPGHRNPQKNIKKPTVNMWGENRVTEIQCLQFDVDVLHRITNCLSL